MEIDIGAQFTIHSATRYTVPQIVKLAEVAMKNGLRRVWLNDNLGYRNTLVVLSAIASKVPIKLGTAVIVPYFRNPVDLADSLASIAELTTGDFAVGIARGSMVHAGRLLLLRKPITMLEEAAVFLKRMLEGEKVVFEDFPFLTEHFRMNPKAAAKLAFRPHIPINLYCGGYSPKSLEVGGRTMDGILMGGFFEAFLRIDRLDRLLEIADAAARKTSPAKRLKKAVEINVSLSENPRRAREDAKKYAAQAIFSLKRLGLSNEEFLRLNVTQRELERLVRAFEQAATAEEVTPFVTDSMVDVVTITGDMETCRAKVLEHCEAAASRGFDEVSFAKLGPDYEEALVLLGRKIVPDL